MRMIPQSLLDRDQGESVSTRGAACELEYPREVKPDEYRVGMMPVGVESLVQAGHEVFVETRPGIGQRVYR